MKIRAIFFTAVLLIAAAALIPDLGPADQGPAAGRNDPPGPVFPAGTPAPQLADPVTAHYGLDDEIPDWVARWELARVLSYNREYGESVSHYRKLLEEKPELAEVKIELARVLFWAGEADEALKTLEEVSPRELEGESLLLLADLYAAREDYRRAEPLYRSHLEAAPDDHKARLKLAEMLGWAARYDDSLAEFERILRARPDDIQVRRRYAGVLIWAGRPEQAAAELKKTLE